MLYRQAIGLLRRTRFSPQTIVPMFCCRTITNASRIPNTSKMAMTSHYESEFIMRSKNPGSIALWILICGQAAMIVGMNGDVALAEDEPIDIGNKNNTEDTGLADLRKVEDGSVISNIHTSKWRVFTDNGRDLSQQGKLDEAERYFLLALQEAKEGFGEKDPHVASACNNLAELYRVKRAFEKAEPFYLEAVEILEESFGPDDVRVGAALHNLGQFYLVQRKLEDARISYERALKIKGRVLGHGHTYYADTMYHLGTVMYLEGKESDSVSLFEKSIRILEEGGEGESTTCLRRLRYLSQIHLNSGRLTKAENIQRKVLHIMELSKGWKSLDTINAAERLALTLQSIGNLKEAKELLQQCLDVRKTILPEDHIQIGANMLHMARVAKLNSDRLLKMDSSEASSELDEAKVLLGNSIRIAQKFLNGTPPKRRNLKDEHTTLVILLQSLISLGVLEISKKEFQEPREDGLSIPEAEHAFRECIATFKETAQSGTRRSICQSPDVKAEYLSCLKHLASLLLERREGRMNNSGEVTLQELRDEIKRVETDLLHRKMRSN